MKRKHWMSALAMASLAVAACAEDVWVKRPVEVRDEASAAAKTVVHAEKGAKAAVVERNGAWVKVDFGGGKVGWVGNDSLATRVVKPDSNAMGTNSLAVMSAGAAGKGLEPMAEEYVKNKGMNKAGVEKMIADNKAVTPDMVKAFKAEGNLHSIVRRKTASVAPATQPAR